MRVLCNLRTYEAALAQAGLGPVAGVDEAGRGACAGPLAVAACILPEKNIPALSRLDDSKKLTPRVRAELFPLIQRYACAWSIVFIDAPTIDAYGIQPSNRVGMLRAIAELDVIPGYVLYDSVAGAQLFLNGLSLIGGDGSARCIAAASVLAKHARDAVMIDADKYYPGYAFAQHKGYGVPAHVEAVRLQGPTPLHRYSYANVQAAIKVWKERAGV